MSSKNRCADCGDTGLKADKDKGTDICACPAGKARERAFEGIWD